MTIFLSADWFYPAHRSGPSNAIYWQAKALTWAGHQVMVVATSQDLPTSVPLDCWLEMDCGRVVYTRNLHFYLPLKHIWYALRAIWQADVVHVNSLFYPSSVALVLAAQVCRKPIIWSPHGELSPQALIYRPRLKRLLLWLFRPLSRNVWFHATAPSETAQIRQHFGDNIIIRELANMMEIPAQVERRASKYLLFIGRLHPIKAIDRLLQAVNQSELFRQSDYILVLAGPGSDVYTQYLMQLVQTLALAEKVVFAGMVHGDRKEQLYADALVTILPSHAENFGNVVIESLAQGTPVIASTGTPWQLLETEQVGSWIDNQSDVLQQAIERYLLMPEAVCQAQRRRARELARTKFDIFANVEQWCHLYEQAAQ